MRFKYTIPQSNHAGGADDVHTLTARKGSVDENHFNSKKVTNTPPSQTTQAGPINSKNALINEHTP